jgi:hypothetical protein
VFQEVVQWKWLSDGVIIPDDANKSIYQELGEGWTVVFHPKRLSSWNRLARSAFLPG